MKKPLQTVILIDALKGTVLKEHLAETFQFSGGSACWRFPRNLSIDSLYGPIEKDNEGIAERAL